MKLTFTVSKNPDKNAKEALLFLISNRTDKAFKIAFIYKIRWTIEHCFKQLKSNGFNLEQVNIRGKAKQNLMLAIVIFTYVLSVLEGLHNYKKIASKRYADGTITKAVSVFRNGLDKIVVLTSSLLKFIKYILKKIRKTEMTYKSSILLNVQ
ncbi:MAG: transposase [Chitinophagales bacterium]